MDVRPVILSGGSGTRLWPASRESYPKQLLRLLHKHSMLQETLLRVEDLAAAPILVGNEEYRFIVAEQVRQLGNEHIELLLEPVGRNTAPALTLAALLAIGDGADPVLLVMPADHAIGNAEHFREAIALGIAAAENGAFITLGTPPTRAETGYGYLRRGSVNNDNGLFALDAFVEKPDAIAARRYLDSGEYLWNSGIFILRASAWLRALELLQPRMLDACKRAMSGRKREGDFVRVDHDAFVECPSDSIDCAVMEKLRSHPQLGPAWIVPLDARWSDVGTWDALWENADKDAEGNVTCGNTVLQDTRNSLVLGQDNGLAVVVGCENLVIVDTPDALLVADRHNTQEVRRAVAKLREEQREEVATHRKVHRPWGWYDSIERGARFQVKRIAVNPGASLSLQMHHRRAEHWVMVRGTARVTRGDEVFDMHENESTFIPLGTKHRLQNMTDEQVEIIEVQCGDYLEEDDIVRFEDVYSRV